mgnify:CR=1 FL=1
MPKYTVLKNKTNSDFSKFVLFPFGGEGEIYELNFEPRAALVCNRIEKHVPYKAKKHRCFTVPTVMQ